MNKPLVSVIIPTCNSDRFLESCLRSVKTQSYSNIEVIVVDKHSTDRTRVIARRFGAKVVLFRGIRSGARNVGAGLAKGEFFFHLDSDMDLMPDVVSECVAKVETGVDAVIVPEISVGVGFWARCRALEKECYVGDDLIEAARFFERGVFDKVGGYDRTLIFGEDWDLCQRVRRAEFRIGRVNALTWHNEGKLSLQEAMFKKRYYGKTLKHYEMRHPEEAKRQLALVRPAFVKNWRKLMADPAHAVGMLLMKTCEFLSIVSGSI